MNHLNIKKAITEIFKLNGLTIRSNAAKYLGQLLEPISQDEHETYIEKVIEAIQKLPLSSPVIDCDTVQKAAEDVGSEVNDDVDSLFQIVDIFKTPRLVFNIERKKFFIDKSYVANLHGDSEDKALLFKRRYQLVYQRTVNHGLFRKLSSAAMQNDTKRSLQKVEYLQGLSSRQDDLIVLGLLTQFTERQFHLEDDTGSIKVDLSQAKFHNGLFTMNCFILVEGWFQDGTLHACTIGLPPPEDAETSRALLGNINYFGGPGNYSQKCISKMQIAEREMNEASLFVILSDVWLDNIEIVSKLEMMFRGYSQFPPIGFIFCGNFLSKSYQHEQVYELKAAFDALADIILSFPDLASKSKFIFVPGPNDFGPGNVLPRPPLADFIVGNFKTKIVNSFFVSNPCRMTYCTQEIVIFREDIFTKMCRNSIFFPADSETVADHFGRTLICEAHLSPLPLHTVPVYWGLDHCMGLHPTPDVVITADKGDPFVTTYNSCTIFNPGSFLKTSFSFKVYFPSNKVVENSKIMENT